MSKSVIHDRLGSVDQDYIGFRIGSYMVAIFLILIKNTIIKNLYDVQVLQLNSQYNKKFIENSRSLTAQYKFTKINKSSNRLHDLNAACICTVCIYV